jgi:hypothetical protein
MITEFGNGRLAICTCTNALILSQPDLKTFDNIYLDTKQHIYVSWACSGLNGDYLYSCVEAEGQYKLYVHNSKNKRVDYFTSPDSEIMLMEHRPT